MPVSRFIRISVFASILFYSAANAAASTKYVRVPRPEGSPPGVQQQETVRGRTDLSPAANAQIHALQQFKETWTRAERKLSTELVVALRRAKGDPLLEQFPDLRTGKDLKPEDVIDVEVHGHVGPDLGAAVSHAGTVVSVGRTTIRARMPLAQTLALAARDDVRHIRRDPGAEVRKDNTSEGDVAHEANIARMLHGIDGTGIKVGVLSDGVDTLAARQATGDLPAVTVIAGQAGSGDEGTAMLEIVHDLAPGAQLYFATAFNGMSSFASNITALAAAGCTIIVDDVFYFAEPTFQDGEIAQAVNDFTAAGGLYFSSAGNSGNLNDGTSGVWEGDFSSAGTDPPVLAGADTHNFGTGSMNTVTVDSPFLFILQWSDATGASANDYDLFLLNNAGTSVIDLSIDLQDGDDDPFEAITSVGFNDTNTQLAIDRFSGASRFLWMNTNRGELAQATSGQTSGHATAASAFGVAATDWWFAAGTNGANVPFDGTEEVELFSSDGPRRMFYDEAGNPYTPGNFSATGGFVRQQPKVTAADGVSTAAPGFNPFFGTSAAAPHAAAIAALVMENSNLTPSGFEQLISATALDIEGVGFDRDSGSGILMATSAVNTTLPDGVGSPECSASALALSGQPNDGPQTFRACDSITAGEGEFDDLTLIAYDDESDTPGTITLQNGFSSNGPLSLRTTSP